MSDQEMQRRNKPNLLSFVETQCNGFRGQNSPVLEDKNQIASTERYACGILMRTRPGNAGVRQGNFNDIPAGPTFNE